MGSARGIKPGQIFMFWAPMAGTWMMMAAEAPFLAAIIARLPDAKENLAAFGVAYAVAILVESPVIMILSASTALVDGRLALDRLRRFTRALNGGVTAAMLLLLLTPAWTSIAEGWIELPPRVASLSHLGLLVLLPWPAAIGYRRFYQGLLIRGGQTRLVAYGTVVRLGSMAGIAIGLSLASRVDGALVGAAALSGGVCAEAIATRWMVRESLATVLARDSRVAPTYRRIWRFYYPLALTSIISMAIHPVVTFFMGHARYPLESLAVLPVVNALTFVFRSVGLSYQEVAIALLDRDDSNTGPVLRFGTVLALAASAGLALIAWSPLGAFWFQDLSGLSDELAAFARIPTRILVVFPALSVLLSVQRAVLVHGRNTTPLTWATLLEIGGIVALLALTIPALGFVGVTAASIAFVGGRLLGNLILVRPCVTVVRKR